MKNNNFDESRNYEKYRTIAVLDLNKLEPEKEPELAEVRALKGNEFYRKKDYEQAVKWYQLAIDACVLKQKEVENTRTPIAKKVIKKEKESPWQARSVYGEKKSSPEELYELGRKYWNGTGVESDLKKAVEYYMKAAEQGNALAQYTLGDCYSIRNYAVTKDLKKAIYWKTKAAENGNVDAQYNLGRIYDGKEYEFWELRNNSLAVQWYKKAAENGHAAAAARVKELEKKEPVKKSTENSPEELYELGRKYWNGTGVEADIKKTAEYFTEAAERGHIPAQRDLSLIYGSSNYTIKDNKKSSYWLKKAAENGDRVAQNSLAQSYEFGLYVNERNVHEKSDTLAFYWYKKAAESGYAPAQNKLGFMYTIGVGVDRNSSLAFQWYKKAAEQGDKWSQRALGDCFRNGQGTEKNLTSAFQWYKKAAEQGDSNGQNALGDCYRLGEGTPKDLKLARQWYEKAAEKGNKSAEEQLKKMNSLTGKFRQMLDTI